MIVLLVQPGIVMGQQTSLSATPSVSVAPPAEAIVAESLPVLDLASNTTALPEESFRPVRSGAIAPVVLVTTPAPTAKPPAHPFWDRQNRILFAVNGAVAGADFFVTCRNLGRNGTELNPVARMFTGSTPGLAANFAMETGGVVGVSYLFHKTGHHKLERMTSCINLGASAFAVTYGLSHH